MSRKRPRAALAASALVASVIGASAPARANPRPLPFTYIYETLPQGEAEVELYTDLTPTRVLSGSAAPTWYLASQFQTEIEYGLTNRLELGLYLTVVPTSPGAMSQPNLTEGNGVKQRLRYRFGEAGQLPIDVAIYGEVTENERELELEAKVILQRRVGPLRVAANAWVEREYYYNGNREWVLNPAAGVVLEKWAAVQPGIEYWMRAEYLDAGGPRAFNQGPNHYVGPTVLLQLGKIWWSFGAYLRLNETDRTVGLGDYGPFWARSIIGLNF